MKPVYKVPISERYTHEGHRLSQLGSGNTTYTFAGGDANGNDPYYYSTTTPDWIPGSGGGLLSRIPSWTYFVSGAYIDPTVWPSGGSYPSTNTPYGGRWATGGLYCASCHSPHGTTFGNATIYKLLSRRPNHTTDTVDTTMSPSAPDGNSYLWSDFVAAGGKWCIRCHKRRWENSTPDGVDPHTHPASVCLQCHGNNSSPSYPTDFPHTGATNLLSDYPDALCIRCHVSGTLP
jgi:hypothetical protein